MKNDADNIQPPVTFPGGPPVPQQNTVSGDEARLTAYGEVEFHINVSVRASIRSFGEVTLEYKGNPQIMKGTNMGEVNVARMD